MMSASSVQYLLVLAFAASAIIASQVADGKSVGGENEPDRKHLVDLIGSIRDRKSPTVEQVVRAYEDYVRLHKRQSELATDYESTSSKADQTADEKRYESIGDILESGEVKLISATLFQAFNPAALKSNAPIKITAKLRAKVDTAIKSLGI